MRILALILLLLPHLAFSETLSSHGYLRKLSLHIRGIDASLDEHRALDDAAKTNKTEEFFSKKIAEYLATKNHVEKMNYRMNEMFWLRSTTIPGDISDDILGKDSTFSYEKEKDGYLNHNALKALFRDIVTE